MVCEFDASLGGYGQAPSMRRPVPVKGFSCPSCDFLPFSQAASVATLPSALLVERFSPGASWVFSFQQVLPSGKRPRLPFIREVLGPGPSRSHLNSAIELGCSVQTPLRRRYLMPLRSSSSGYYAAVRTPLHSPTTDVAVPIASALPQRQLVSWRFFLLARQVMSPPSQIAVFPKRSQNVMRSLHQQRP
jgi:hypothetical protein